MVTSERFPETNERYTRANHLLNVAAKPTRTFSAGDMPVLNSLKKSGTPFNPFEKNSHTERETGVFPNEIDGWIGYLQMKNGWSAEKLSNLNWRHLYLGFRSDKWQDEVTVYSSIRGERSYVFLGSAKITDLSSSFIGKVQSAAQIEIPQRRIVFPLDEDPFRLYSTDYLVKVENYVFEDRASKPVRKLKNRIVTKSRLVIANPDRELPWRRKQSEGVDTSGREIVYLWNNDGKYVCIAFPYGTNPDEIIYCVIRKGGGHDVFVLPTVNSDMDYELDESKTSMDWIAELEIEEAKKDSAYNKVKKLRDRDAKALEELLQETGEVQSSSVDSSQEGRQTLFQATHSSNSKKKTQPEGRLTTIPSRESNLSCESNLSSDFPGLQPGVSKPPSAFSHSATSPFQPLSSNVSKARFSVGSPSRPFFDTPTKNSRPSIAMPSSQNPRYSYPLTVPTNFGVQSSLKRSACGSSVAAAFQQTSQSPPLSQQLALTVAEKEPQTSSWLSVEGNYDNFELSNPTNPARSVFVKNRHLSGPVLPSKLRRNL